MRILAFLIASASLLNATASVSRLYEVNKPQLVNGRLVVTFNWYSEGKIVGHYLDLRDPAVSKNIAVAYAAKQAGAALSKLAPNSRFEAMEVKEEDHKITMIVFYLHNVTASEEPNTAYGGLLKLQASYRRLLWLIDNAKLPQRKKAIEDYFGPGVHRAQARQETTSLLNATDHALMASRYISQHGLYCYFGDRSKCLDPSLHKDQK